MVPALEWLVLISMPNFSGTATGRKVQSKAPKNGNQPFNARGNARLNAARDRILRVGLAEPILVAKKFTGPTGQCCPEIQIGVSYFRSIGWRMSLMPGAMVALRLCLAAVSAAACGQAACAADLSVRRQSLRRRGHRAAVPAAVLGPHMFIIGRWSRPTASIWILVTTIRQCLITILGAYVPIRGTSSTAFPCKDPATRPLSTSLGALNQGNSIRWRCLPATCFGPLDENFAAFFSRPFIFNLGHGRTLPETPLSRVAGISEAGGDLRKTGSAFALFPSKMGSFAVNRS